MVGGLSLLLVLFQSGCYTYLPLQSEPPQSPEVRVQLNDRGRTTMMETLGPMVAWVEGVLAGEDSTSVRLRVTRVVFSQGGSSVWTGEEVSIRKDGILGFRGRQFSKAKSWALAGLTVAVITVSILSVNFDIFNTEQDERCTGPTCGPGESIRW